MEQRFSLRFESGERQGETISVSVGGFSVGRKPGNTLQILDNSVSGQHAEIVIDGAGALLKDLGSTNGTRVNGERVLEKRLQHEDLVLFGNIRLVWLDGERMGAPAAPAPAAVVRQTSPTEPAGGLERVSAEVMERAKKRSFVPLIGLAVLVAAGAGLWFWLQRDGAPTQGATRAVETVAGNLLEDPSFEGERELWSAAEGSSASFLEVGDARYGGAVGMSADLEARGFALQRSANARADAGAELTARAHVRVRGGARAFVGIELIGGEAGPSDVIAWSQALTAGAFTPLEVRTLVPRGYTEARMVVLARADDESGSVAFDDVSLVARAAQDAPVALGDFQLIMLGRPSTQAALVSVDKVLFSSVAAYAPAAEIPVGPGVELTVQPNATGAALGADGAATLVLRVEAPLVRGGIASIGDGGWRTHTGEFERENATSLVLGGGRELVRFGFASPVDVSARALGASVQIHARARGQALPAISLQLDFADDRKQAGDVAHQARGAEKKGEIGAALAAWSQLLDRFPYEDALVSEAEATRARLVQKGLEELRAVRADAERARFFQLLDLFRQCHARALAVGARYRESEVDLEATKLANEIQGDLASLDADRNALERGRLEAILAGLEAQKATALAGQVRRRLEELKQ